jgi:hypothetical protein
MTGFSACKGGDSAPGLRDWVATTERMLGLRPMPPEPEPQTLAFLITDIEGSTRYVGAGSEGRTICGKHVFFDPTRFGRDE